MTPDAPVKIVTDSACDLPRALLEAYDIRIVPLVVYLDSEELADPLLDPDTFWAEVTRRQARPSTAAPAPGTVAEVIGPLVEQGHQVLALTLSSRLTGVYESFRVAAQAFPGRVEVFDTQSLSLGEGVQVLEAARMASKGATLPQLCAMLRDIRPRVHLQAVLDTLAWAERGGRIAYLMPIIRRATRLFNVKVLLRVEDGLVHYMGSARSLQGAIHVLEKRTLSLAPVTRLLIPHTRQHQLAESLADRLAPALNLRRKDVIVQEAGPILSAHVGPGVIGTVVVSAAG